MRLVRYVRQTSLRRADDPKIIATMAIVAAIRLWATASRHAHT